MKTNIPNNKSFFAEFSAYQVSFRVSITMAMTLPEPVGVGAAFLVDGFVYALVALVAAVQLARNCCRYRPWTVQKMIHLLLFLATLSAFVAH